MAVVVDKRTLALAKLKGRATQLPDQSPEPIGTPQDSGDQKVLAILDRVTALLEKEPTPFDDKMIRAELAYIRKALVRPKRKFKFKFVRDNNDFITEIVATEI